eukprot:6093846-Amphidinium_carterae.1
MQVVEAENAQLRANGLGALPQLIQVLQTPTQQRLPSLVDTKGIGKPAFDVLRNAPVGAGLEGWRRMTLVPPRGSARCCAASSTLGRPPASLRYAPPLRSGRSRSARMSARRTR